VSVPVNLDHIRVTRLAAAANFWPGPIGFLYFLLASLFNFTRPWRIVANFRVRNPAGSLTKSSLSVRSSGRARPNRSRARASGPSHASLYGETFDFLYSISSVSLDLLVREFDVPSPFDFRHLSSFDFRCSACAAVVLTRAT
jgi:hypothetical protein